eukprot:scaffold652_cov100-Isochrysis_galbana.AAC.7
MVWCAMTTSGGRPGLGPPDALGTNSRVSPTSSRRRRLPGEDLFAHALVLTHLDCPLRGLWRAVGPRSKRGQEGHQEEHGPQVGQDNGEHEEETELREYLQLTRGQDDRGDERGGHAPEDGDAHLLQGHVRTFQRAARASLHVGVGQVDDVVNGEAGERHEAQRLDGTELPSHGHGGADDADQHATDGDDAQGGGDQVARGEQ